MPQRVLVTGASGFLGAWTARALLAAGHRVTALVRAEAPWRLHGVDGIEVVTADPADWPASIAAHRPDVLLLLDWAGVDGASRDSDAQWANLDRHRAMIDAAVAGGVGRIVASGSQAEYGPRTDRIAEDAPAAPVTEYGRAKVAALVQLAERADDAGIEWVWARVFSVYGPLDNEGMLLQKVSDALRSGDELALSSGEQAWSYLYAADAGRALAHLARPATAPSGIVNVGHPEAPRLRDTIERFAADVGGTGTLRFGAAGTAAIARLDPDMTRLAAAGWRPEVDLASGLAATAAWLRGDDVADPLAPGRTLPRRPGVHGSR